MKTVLCNEMLKLCKSSVLNIDFQDFLICGFWFMTAFSSQKKLCFSLGAYVAKLGSKLIYIIYYLTVKTKVLLLHISFWLNWVSVKLNVISPREAQRRSGAIVELPDGICKTQILSFIHYRIWEGFPQKKSRNFLGHKF